MITTGLMSSNRDDWETPPELYAALDAEFSFNLDVAASDANHKCAAYYTKETDGLSKNWGGYTVFCNPPYGNAIKRWVRKAYEEAKKPGTTVVMVLPARTDTGWFHDWILGTAEIRFIRGRLRFSGATQNAPFPSMVVIYRNGKETNGSVLQSGEVR